MSDSTELLLLRLALLALIFFFVLIAALTLRGSLTPRRPSLPAGRGHARLVVEAPARTGLARGTEFDLPGGTTIGRDSSNGIVLADSSISSRHAAIERNARGWFVRDLGSTNGTFVGAQVANGTGLALRSGDELRVGAVRFRFLA